ncbi:unnamed protein product [Sphenostylis stenocarpa]|uniref:Uncharacterized protein n=1 Tax=Sphenostylis stenocarpa TaxID=92480 RepID=A0AA86T0B6_9FABA|nr:unnamed protein product [Sphenostylis stenocarpa]
MMSLSETYFENSVCLDDDKFRYFSAMHRVGNGGNTNNSTRPRKGKRLTYVLNDADDTKHCAGINCLSLLKSAPSDGFDYLFTGSRDSKLNRWALVDDMPSCSATFESHLDWVNDVVLVGDNVLVSCSSDRTLKTWNVLSTGKCTRTLRKHSDYVTCLATAEKNNVVASGGLGGEVFIWDIEVAIPSAEKCNDRMDDDNSNGTDRFGNSLPNTSLPTTNSSNNNISTNTAQTQEYIPIVAKGHKESVYALAMNEGGTILVSGGTEKVNYGILVRFLTCVASDVTFGYKNVVRVWDPRTGSKTSKLKGHTDNIRALLLDSTGRFCISGSSDSMIRLWDLGQQRCVHSYAVHTDSVWALASTSTFSHVYSGGRDNSVYLTDLQTRESALVCTGENPILHLALNDDNIWVTSTDSSVHRWPAEGRNPQKIFQRDNSSLTGNLSCSKARVSSEESTPDTSGSVKLWEITKGVVVEDYGKVSLEEKKEDLFEKVNIPAWFTVDTRLGCLSVHLDSPQCFSAEMFKADLNIVGKPEDDKFATRLPFCSFGKCFGCNSVVLVSNEKKTRKSIMSYITEVYLLEGILLCASTVFCIKFHCSMLAYIYHQQAKLPKLVLACFFRYKEAVCDSSLSLQVNLGQETLKGLLANWLRKRKQRMRSAAPTNGELLPGRMEVDGSSETNAVVYPPFQFSNDSPPSFITEGSNGVPWSKKITHFDGTEDEKDFPWWCLDCVLNNCLPFKENTK